MRSLLLLTLALGAPQPGYFLAPFTSGSAALAPQPPAGPGGAAETRESRLAEVRSLLGESKLTEALEKANRAVEFDSEDPEVLTVAADAYEALGNKDLALWHLLRAQAIAQEDPDAKKLATELAKRVAAMDPLLPELSEAFNSLADDTFRMGQSAQKRGLWANAVDLFLRCDGTAFEDRAQKQLDLIYGSQKAAEALVASGLPIPVTDRRRKSLKAIAKFDRDTADWEKANKSKEFFSKQYRVTTNMGWEMGTTISTTMEQLNKFLRGFFRHKEQGQPMRDCGVRVIGSFDDWGAVEGQDSPSIGGFFVPMENRISTYDQTTVGRPFEMLWEVLFHEGTHQFSKDVTKTLLPGWVEEGAACYMEGAKLLPNGVVVSNLVSDSRLEDLVAMLGPRPKSGSTATKPTIANAAVDIHEVITYYSPGSYSGMYYPWGWGLVYFMRNYEDQDGDRPYLPAFEAFVEAYKSERKHSVLDRFVQFFITDLKRPGIDTFEDWYAQWVTWIWELSDINFGGPEQADKLIARGEKQVQNGKAAFATESFAWALRKRPGDPRALLGQARAKQALKDDDGAAFFYRQGLAWTATQGDEEATVSTMSLKVKDYRAEAWEGIRTIHSSMVEGSERTQTAFREALAGLAGRYLEAGFPTTAAYRLQEARQAAGPMVVLTQIEGQLAKDHGVDLRQMRRLPLGADLSGWTAQGIPVFKSTGEKITTQAKDGLGYLIFEAEAPAAFEFSAQVTLEKAGDFYAFGLVYGESLGGRKMVGVLRGGRLVRIKATKTGPEIEAELGLIDISPGATVQLTLRYEGTQVHCSVNGDEVAAFDVPASEAAGRVGLFSQNVKLSFSDLRLRY